MIARQEEEPQTQAVSIKNAQSNCFFSVIFNPKKYAKLHVQLLNLYSQQGAFCTSMKNQS